MIGYLIDGKWIAPQAIETVEYLKLSNSATWIPAASIEEWNGLAETSRAIKIRTNSGADVLLERPATCTRFNLDSLMVETKPARPETGNTGIVPPRPEIPEGVTLP